MSLVERLIKERQQKKGYFAVVGGERMTGKSTLAGTLPGRTLLVQPAHIESGNESPLEKAAECGNHVDLIQLENYEMFFELLTDEAVKEYDNIYIDGISAMSMQLYKSPKFKVIEKKTNNWDAFRFVKDVLQDFMEAMKQYAEVNDKNVFITYATEPVINKQTQQVESMRTVAMGNYPQKFVEEGAGTVVQSIVATDAEGNTKRALITSHTGPYHARVGDLLDGKAPKSLPHDLSELLKLAGRI